MSIFSTALGGLGTAYNTLINSGLSAADAGTAISAIFGGAKSTVMPMLTAIIANAGDQALVRDEATKIKEVPNLPNANAISSVLDQLVAKSGTSTSIGDIMPLITDIENLLA